MEKRIAELSVVEFEELIESTIDRRLEVWLVQLMDVLGSSREEETAELQPEFVASLRRSLEQAGSGQHLNLKNFRDQIGQ